MLDTAAPHLEHMLLNQTAVILTPPMSDEDDDLFDELRPRAGTVGRIIGVEDRMVWLEITLPFTDVDGITWYFENDVPEGYHDGLGIHGARTFHVEMPHTSVAILSPGSLAKSMPTDILSRRDITASAVVKILAQQRLQEATDALREVLELVSVGVEITVEDDDFLRTMVRCLVKRRVISHMHRRIQEFFQERPWFWQLTTRVHAFGEEYYVRVESEPPAPNRYQAEALDQLGMDLAAMLEPECDLLSGHFNLVWDNPGVGDYYGTGTRGLRRGVH